ncbi:MAG: VWA domain-containing protein [Nannocystaceae bacterium]
MPARWPSFALALALAPLLPAAEARADSFHWTRSEQLVERTHTVDLQMADDHATMVVRRTVHNGGPRHDQAVFWIDLPETAVATGLRTMAMVKGKPVWYEGQLMEAEAAAAKYQELTGIGGYYPKDPALLSWRSPSNLALQVFPCPPGEDKTVEYTLTLPVEYAAGQAFVKLSRLGTEAIAADIRVRPADRRDQVLLNGAPVPPGARVRWPGQAEIDATIDDVDDVDDDDNDAPYREDPLAHGPHEVLVSLARRDPPRLSGRVASVAFGGTRHLREFEIDAAPRLSKAPRGAHVVVLVDTSRSLSDESIQASLRAASYAIEGLPDARVEVITFDREATPLFGRFLPAQAALAGLAGLTPARKNGSDVDLALARAGELLARAPRGAAKRVLLLTDTMTRHSLTDARLRGALAASGALVHIGLPDLGYTSELLRDDSHQWSAAVRGTGGLVWSASVSEGTSERAKARGRAVYEEWARPLRIDHLKVVGAGIGEGDLDLPGSLYEGEGIRELGIHSATLPWVRLEGELWASPIREVFTRDADHGRLWSALVFGSELLDELSEPEMMSLAMHGGAVSPVTSYLAIEPGVRPSTEGLEEGEIGLGGLGLIGRGSGGGSGVGYGGVRPDPLTWLRAELNTLRAACSAPPLTLTMESTIDEVVAVEVTGRLDAVARHCVEEGVWAWDLPGSFTQRWARHVVHATA